MGEEGGGRAEDTRTSVKTAGVTKTGSMKGKNISEG